MSGNCFKRKENVDWQYIPDIEKQVVVFELSTTQCIEYCGQLNHSNRRGARLISAVSSGRISLISA
jgi:hypothetical protein